MKIGSFIFHFMILLKKYERDSEHLGATLASPRTNACAWENKEHFPAKCPNEVIARIGYVWKLIKYEAYLSLIFNIYC